MKLVDQSEVIRRQMVDVFSCLLQRGEDYLAEIPAGVVSSTGFR